VSKSTDFIFFFGQTILLNLSDLQVHGGWL